MEFATNLDVIINETLPALQKVKESGKARFIGITGYPLENFRSGQPTYHILFYFAAINKVKKKCIQM
jgi:aryl-alcohol dehydrogenase-like predicted oxidoreductase